MAWHRVAHPALQVHGSELWLYLPGSLANPVAGNKEAKLYYPLLQAEEQNKRGIATFGGAFSNHLLATAAACQSRGLESMGWVRTDRLDPENPTLKKCLALGMTLQPVSREDYRLRHETSWQTALEAAYPGWIWVPEGGSSALGVAGVARLNLADTPAGAATHLVTATGSGGTVAGLAKGHPELEVVGITVVKDASLPEKIADLSDNRPNIKLETGFVGSGYGRFSDEQLAFCLDFKAHTGISIEPVYTGKALYALFKLIEQGRFRPGSRLSFFHTGGLQGLDGLVYRGLISDRHCRQLQPSTADANSLMALNSQSTAN